jgi:hypothetical protein
MTMEQLKAECRGKIAKMFSEALPEVAQGMIDLALHSEADSVRFRASDRILNEFNAFGNAKNMTGTNVQIINAIPFERAAYDGKKELTQETLGNLRMATATYKQITPKGDDVKVSTRESYAAGERMSKEKLDSMKMNRLGGPVEHDPVPVPVK